jgi:hypothetical protein
MHSVVAELELELELAPVIMISLELELELEAPQENSMPSSAGIVILIATFDWSKTSFKMPASFVLILSM